MILKLVNNLSKKTHILNDLEDKNDSNHFYHFNITLPFSNVNGIDVTLVDEGEYTYELIDGENIVAQGLIQIGDYKKDENINKVYKTEKIYKVYGE